MKCTIKNISPNTVGIFARVNGVDARFEIGSGKELVADNYETRIMKIYKKKGLLKITPYVKSVTEELNENSEIDVKDINPVAPNISTETVELKAISKTLKEVQDEVEQYVEDGYIKGAWAEEDVVFLKKNYPTKGRKYCSNKLNRNESSVQKKINSMGLKKKKKKKKK